LPTIRSGVDPRTSNDKFQLFEFLLVTMRIYDVAGIPQPPGPFDFEVGVGYVDFIWALKSLQKDLEKRSGLV
jgi:hypothetical protein